MRLTGVLGVLCVVAAPALAGPVTYTFNLTSGSVALEVRGIGDPVTTSGSLGGTFAVVIYQSDCHIGPSDTFVLGTEGRDLGLTNTSTLVVSLAGLGTARIRSGSARFLDYRNPEGWVGHIPPGGCPVLTPTDLYLEATIFVTGITTTTFKIAQWAETFLPFNMAIQTSVERSDPFRACFGGTFRYETDLEGIVLTIDLVVAMEGTAHVVPDPALGGLTALGLGGAGAWLRRRR